MNRILLIIATLVAGLLISCTTGVRPERQPAPVYNGPVDSEALAGRIVFSGLTGGLRAGIRARLWRGDESLGSFDGALVMRPPDDMRVVLYNTFGTTVMDIVRARGRIEAYVPSKDALYLGHAPSLMPPAGSTMVMESASEAYYLYAMVEGRAVREYVFDKFSALNTRVSVLDVEGLVMEAEFFDHTGTLPGRAVLRYGRGLFRIDFTIQDAETGGVVPEGLIPTGRSAANVFDIKDLQ